MQDGRPARQEQAILLPGGDARPPWHSSLFTSPVTGG